MKRIFLLISLCAILACTLALAVSAECVHTGSVELKFGENGYLGEWEAINTCSSCGIVLADEFYEPLVASRGYSYFNGSFAQGFDINHSSVEMYEFYTGTEFEFGIVAGITGIVGNTPVNADGIANSDRAVTHDLSQSKTQQIDIKVVNVPSDNYDTKIIACIYTVSDGNVSYVDGIETGGAIAGVTYNEIIDVVDNGGIPSGLEEYRALTAYEMDILLQRYWQSNHGTEYAVRRNVDNTYQKFAATRMFTRDELPSGSYIVVADGWSFRPEVWRADENGNPTKQTGTRPGNIGAGTYTIESLWQDTDSGKSDYDFIGFNISEGNGAYADMMTAQGIADVLKIYVPYTTKVARNEIDGIENVSVAGKQLVEWTTEKLKKSKYWSNQYSVSSGVRGSNEYYATELFTKETLPVGSVIEINEGWLYRAEYWKNSSKTSPRGSLCNTYRFVVTEEFWEGISERGFNISRLTKGSLNGYSFEDIASAFRIYVPVNN